jgi:hypothetical protein
MIGIYPGYSIYTILYRFQMYATQYAKYAKQYAKQYAEKYAFFVDNCPVVWCE